MQYRKEKGSPCCTTASSVVKNFARGRNSEASIVFRPRTGFPFSKEAIMGRRSGRPPRARGHREPWGRTPEFEAFLCPEAAFSDPFEIVAHPTVGIGEKRAILSRWLARICATEASLGLKWMPQANAGTVEFDDVMDALRALEREGPGRVARPASGSTDVSFRRKPQKSASTIH
jgi:hypothetical protein